MKLKIMAATLIINLLLAGCASTQLKAPCPNFGTHCRKVPINSWDYKNT